MRVAFGESRVFRRIEPRVHAGENGETAGRRKSKLALLSETLRIGSIGLENLADNFRHGKLPLRGGLWPKSATVASDNHAARR
jgi:hypothetical protein